MTYVCRWCQRENEDTQLACSNCGTGRGARSPVEGPPLGNAYVPTKSQTRKLFKENPDLDVRTADTILKEMRELSEKRGRISDRPRARWVPDDERHMLEVGLMDLHVGKLAHESETGENYDAKIAVERARAALDDLLAQASHYPIERALLPWGNDLVHYDNLAGTTAGGTPQDRDSRYQLMFRRAFRLSVETITRCLDVAPVVEVVVVPGNHAPISEFTLGVALEAYFHAEPRVVIQNGPEPRKYVRYGVNLIGFAHGHNEPHKRLPLLMPVEARDLWADTTHREWHLGHFHKSKLTDPVRVDGENGVRTRILSSLSGVDSWHASMGYVGEPASAEAFVWSRSRGLRAHFMATLPRTGVPRSSARRSDAA